MYFFGLPKIIIKKEQLSIDSARTQHMETTIYGKTMQLGTLSNYLVVSAVGKFYF